MLHQSLRWATHVTPVTEMGDAVPSEWRSLPKPVLCLSFANNFQTHAHIYYSISKNPPSHDGLLLPGCTSGYNSNEVTVG